MKRFAVLAAALALFAAACGGDDDDTSAADGTRTIEIEMMDIEYSPDEIEVAAGETIRFVFDNTGAVAHDAFVGDEDAQADHEDEMGEDEGGMDHGADDDGVTVDPGEVGELSYTFDEPGTFLIGCHQPGHYDAGMIVTVDVT